MDLAIKSINLRNLLSFGPDGICPDSATGELELRPLNIIIGPNGVGKSNLIDAISLLQAAARGVLYEAMDASGGVIDWIWKGSELTKTASIQAVVSYPSGSKKLGNELLRYNLAFSEAMYIGQGGIRVAIQEEYLRNAHLELKQPPYKPAFSYLEFNAMGNLVGRLRVSYRVEDAVQGEKEHRIWVSSEETLQESALPKVSAACPEVVFVRSKFDSFRLYREWGVGRNSSLRRPQEFKTMGDNRLLQEDASNLPGLLSSLPPDESALIRDYLRKFYGNDAQDLRLDMDDGKFTLLIDERNFSTPASRLSDGTVRWLALLAVLLPQPAPALICLEEPEIGLHPDMIPVLARLLKDASQHTQIIVTTHSDILVDAFTDEPENVVVCEKEDGATKMKRLVRKELSSPLKDYSLSELWSMGQIGGNRV